MRTGPLPPLLLVILALSLALNAWGLDWGLPSEYGWAPDEVLPPAVLAAWHQGFSGGWHEKYPPLHYALLGLAYGPVLLMTRLAELSAAETHHALFLAGRALSLLLAAGTVVVVYLCGRELEDEASALLTALLTALSVPFVFYAKLANLDVPYVFWFSLALLFYLRILKRHQRHDYILFAACAAASVAVKDQAYALYVLTPLAIVPSLRRARAHEGKRSRIGETLRDGRVLAAAVTGTVSLLVLDNVLGNPAGFAAHVRLITGSASRDFRTFPSDVGGQMALLGQTVQHLWFSMGGPAFIASILGIALAVGRRRSESLRLALLVPALSYYLFFLAVVLYAYDRFVLPICLVLSFFGGKLLAVAIRARGAARLAAAAVVAYSILYAGSVGVLLSRDSRYRVEDWLRRNATSGDLVAAVGPLEYLPRLHGLRWRRLGPSPQRLAEVCPDYVVVNADYAARAEPATRDHDLYSGLEDGRLGYELVLRQDPEVTGSLLDPERLRKETSGIVTNLDKVSPRILVYRRRAVSGGPLSP